MALKMAKIGIILLLLPLLLLVDSKSLVVKRQAASEEKKTDLFGGIVELFGAAAEAVGTLHEIQMTALEPLVETGAKAGEILQKAPLIKTLEERGGDLEETVEDKVCSRGSTIGNFVCYLPQNLVLLRHGLLHIDRETVTKVIMEQQL